MNYQEKYILLELNQRTSYSIPFLIPIKCLLLKEIKRYNNDGTIKYWYEVYLPYNKALKNFKSPLVSIEINSLRSFYFDKIYDTYNDALKSAIAKNRNMIKDYFEEIKYRYCEDRINDIKEQVYEDKKYFKNIIRELIKEENN